MLPPAEIEGALELAERHNLWLIFDQVYADLLHVAPFAYPQASKAGHARTLVVDSFSKTFGMTGWRLGYLALPSGMAKTVQRFLQHSVYCVPGFIQTAGIEALSLFDEVVPRYRERFRRRQLHAVERLNAIPGIKCQAPGASFYLFPSVEADDAALAAHWLDTLGVAALPGSAFGTTGAGHLRLSVTSDDADIDAALDLISKAGIAV